MTADEAELRRSEIDVSRQAEKVRRAKAELVAGKARLAAEYEAAMARLEQEVREAELVLAREQTYVTELAAKIARGFEK